jgi:glycosyltransferase involved in cell wall biosynthesis
LIRVDWLITGLTILGGAEVFTTQLAPYIAASGIQLRVITLRSGGELISNLTNQGIPVIEIGINRKFNSLPLFRLYNLWQKAPPHILHTHLYHAGIVGRLIARFAGIQYVVVHQHGTENNRGAFRIVLDRVTSGMVDRYVVPSKAVGDVLSMREHIAESKIHLIHYGININTHLPISSIPYAASTTKIPMIGCVSRLVREKSHPVLLRALQLLKLTGVQFHTTIVGDGPERKNLEKLTHQFGLTDVVSWVGIQHDIPSWLAKFDIFVLPSAWEGLPISILEAMAARLPIVATAVGGTPEAVIDNQTGILVPSGDSDQLFQALHRLIFNAYLRAQMGKAGRIRVEENFSITMAADKTRNLYSQLLGQSQPSTVQIQSQDG